MQRLVRVEFGPSRSKRFGKALAEAESGPGECSEPEPGRYRVNFILGEDAATYTGLARLLERVRHWRATDVYEDDDRVPVFHAREMAWCASSQLNSFGDCCFRFVDGVLPRCALCPLFDGGRAIRDALRKDESPAPVVQIVIAADSWALLQDEFLPELDPGWEAPDFPPADWEDPAG